MSRNKAPIPPPKHVQGSSNPPPVPPHGHRIAALRLPAEVAKNNLASERLPVAEESPSSPPVSKNVNFALHTEYEDPAMLGQEGAEVAIELGESAVSEHNSDSNSDRSEISNAPTVEHFNISFEYKKTFREHEGARAFHSFNKILKLVYNQCLIWTYNILLLIVGMLVAVLWAIINGLVAFIQTWFISPATRVSLVIIRGLLPLILEPVGLILKTCANACGCRAGCMNGMNGMRGMGGLDGGLETIQRPGRLFSV